MNRDMPKYRYRKQAALSSWFLPTILLLVLICTQLSTELTTKAIQVNGDACAEIELSSLDGTNGFAINGEAQDDRSGLSVSYAGDVNGDNIDDIIISTQHADPNGKDKAGKTYVVFGKSTSESASFPSELELSSLDGTNGFAINGEADGDESGHSVSYAGDVNGDNVDDIIIGAPEADPSEISRAGTSYVVFGRDTSETASFPAELLLSSLDGTNGFAINGEAESDLSGFSVSFAGDVNGDDIDDIIIGAPSIWAAGTSYVVFGRNTAESTNFPSELELSSLDGTNGFAINGVDNGDNSGWSVSSAGDVNADNIADIIIGAYAADPNGISGAGKSYVVFGGETSELVSFPAVLELSSLDGTNGFTINGEANVDWSGRSVSYAGDVNGDNIDDIVVGAFGASPNGKDGAGTSYVVFGKNTAQSASFPSVLELSSLDGTNGFAINGEAEDDNSGLSVSYAGDVNGDDIDDIIIGAPQWLSVFGAGTSYVVFGKNTAESTSFPAELELSSLDGTNGFAINGESDGVDSGNSVSYAGDVNGDGIGDIIIGAPDAAPNGISDAGKSYVVFRIECAPDTTESPSTGSILNQHTAMKLLVAICLLLSGILSL